MDLEEAEKQIAELTFTVLQQEIELRNLREIMSMIDLLHKYSLPKGRE